MKDKNYKPRNHRATGAPRGRPPSLPFDLGERILTNLENRMDPETRLVSPLLAKIAREIGVSLSSIKREVTALKRSGFIEAVCLRDCPDKSVATVYYRLPKSADKGSSLISKGQPFSEARLQNPKPESQNSLP